MLQSDFDDDTDLGVSQIAQSFNLAGDIRAHFANEVIDAVIVC